ncbi:hypothetical protein HZU77_006845, partial [Neisseriaceae bacterium TC5R-5]|nr:hypothetical protein [Neisseriaceae bacterium TC5R-5]
MLTLPVERTLRMQCAAIPAIAGEPLLTSVSLKGSETLNQLFEYELVLRTPNSHSPHYYAAANLALNTLVG